MNFDLSEDERLIQQTARDFADRVLKPRAAEFDRAGNVPRDILSQMAELGFMGMLVPEELGGSGLNNFALALVQMEINRACASTGVTMSVHNSLFTSPVIRFGTEAQKRTYLPRLSKAELIGAYSLSEPGSGSDAGALRATAVKQDGHWVLNGTKNFVTNGGIADLFIVFARTHPDPALKTRGSARSSSSGTRRASPSASTSRSSASAARRRRSSRSRTAGCRRRISSGRRTGDSRSR